MLKDPIGRRDFMKGLAGAAAGALPIVPAALAAEPCAAKRGAGDSSNGSTYGEPWFVRADPSWVNKLSQPQHEIQFEFDMKIPMRDGVMLSANIWRPKVEGKFPVVRFQALPHRHESEDSSHGLKTRYLRTVLHLQTV